MIEVPDNYLMKDYIRCNKLNVETPENVRNGTGPFTLLCFLQFVKEVCTVFIKYFQISDLTTSRQIRSQNKADYTFLSNNSYRLSE